MRENEKAPKPPRYWQVIDAAVAKVNRHLDIGDIQEIDELGKLRSVTRLPGNKVEIVLGKETHTMCDAFITLEEAEYHAQTILQKEIERLQRKCAHLAH